MLKALTIALLLLMACKPADKTSNASIQADSVQTGAMQTDQYFPLLSGKKVGLTVNHSSIVGAKHLTDTLLRVGIDVRKVFTPEHGFTGAASDGETVTYGKSEKPYELISLYGNNKKPTAEQLAGLDIMVFDIQDVGTRFYTYISTMHYVMQACAEENIPMLILDRPNPNGSYVDGPILEPTHQSFVGMHPIPIVHGMTIGELAQMINGEGWLETQNAVQLTVIPVTNWNRTDVYSLPVKPSPNLPNDLSIALYPSLCLFEGTIMSVGRGTDHAFQQIGHPEFPDGAYSFTPSSREGSKHPPYEDLACYGLSWIGTKPNYKLSLQPLIDAYKKMNREDFFNDYFVKLAGTNKLQTQIEAGMSEKEIKETWRESLDNFKEVRSKYLIYSD